MKGVMPEISVADSSQMFKVLQNWSETGLPRLAPRRRLEKFLKTIPPNSRLLVNASDRRTYGVSSQLAANSFGWWRREAPKSILSHPLQ
jgi:hypothetical protein